MVVRGGKLAIGSKAKTNSNRQLVLYNYSTPVIQLVNNDTGTGTNSGSFIGLGNDDFWITNQEPNGHIKLTNYGGEQVRISGGGDGTSSGDVKIFKKLNVVGDITGSAGKFTNLPTSDVGLDTGGLYTQTGAQVGVSGYDTKKFVLIK
jgi:hypothetical protein